MLHQILNFLYPPSCALCAREFSPLSETNDKHPLQVTQALSTVLCPECNVLDRYLLPRLTSAFEPPPPACKRCGELLLPSESVSCDLCAFYPLPLEEIRTVFPYEGHVEHLLKRYKYEKQRAIGSPLGEILGSACRHPFFFSSGFIEDFPGYIIPLPSSSDSLRRRGFPHVLPIAKEIGRQLRRPVLVVTLRSRGTRHPQAGLKAAQRAKNMRDAFQVFESVGFKLGTWGTGTNRILDQSVLLVDDIATSGASMASAARTLREAGARKVYGITFARSKFFSRHRMALAIREYRAKAEVKTPIV